MSLHLNILNSLNGGVVYADNDHVIQYMDEKAQEHFSKSGGKDLIGKNLTDFHRPAAMEKIKAYQQQMLEGKLDEVMVRKMDKLNAYMKAVRNEVGALIGYIEYFKPMVSTTQPVKENLYQKSYMLYDEILKFRGKSADLSFFKQVIPTQASVLEVGCGTGRIAYELAKRGNQVVGLDLSKEMLGILNEKIVNGLDEIEGKIRTAHANMIDFNLNQEFDWIILPFRVFQLLLTDKFRTHCLENIKKHLKSEGKVIIDLFDPDPSAFKDWENRRTLEMSFYSEVLGTTIKREHVGGKHFDKQQIISYSNIYEVLTSGQEPIILEEPMRMAYWYEEQATNLFEEHQFNIQNIYGDWDFSPVSREHKRELIYILSPQA